MASRERAGSERCLLDFVATVAASAAYQGSKAPVEGGKQLLLTHWIGIPSLQTYRHAVSKGITCDPSEVCFGRTNPSSVVRQTTQLDETMLQKQ